MSDNIDRLLATGKQKYLNYEVRQPYKVEGLKISQGLSMMTSQAEYLKTGFNYPSYKIFDPQNQYDKTLVHQQDGQTLEFKLATVLDKTEKYMVHIKYLRLAMEAGYELDKVHGDFKFAQDYEFKFDIDGNNNIKADATKSGNKFLRDLAKFLSNIIYGKTVQNILKQRDFEFPIIGK